MKSSLKKLRAFTLIKNAARDKGPSKEVAGRLSYEVDTGPTVQILTDMEEQYDGLLAAAQSISGSSYDFSRSIHEMASYLVETFGKTGDGDIGNSFSMLAKVQYEISKLLSLYACHVSQTIIKPTESFLKELDSFREFRRKHEEKRDLYNQLKLEKPKGRQKKGDALNQKLINIREELHNETTQLELRFQSLRRGQELSLVTQAARHHKAQVHMFTKGLNSLNAVDSMIKQLSSEYHVDETLSDGEAGLQVNEDSYEVEADFPVDNDDDVSSCSSPSIFHPKTSERRVSGRPGPWENSSKSAPLHPLSYAGTVHAPIIQEVDGEQPSEKVTPYALPSPRDTNMRFYNQTVNNVSRADELAMGELPELRRIRTGNLTAFEEIGAPKLEVLNQTNGKHVPKREEAHRWKEDRSFSRGRSSSHMYSTSFSEGMDSFSVTSPSQQGFLASTPPRNLNRVNGESDVVMPAVRIVDPLYKSGPVRRSGPWGRTPPRVSPVSSPPMPHVSPPMISELHKLPAPPSPPPPPKLEPSITHSAPLGKPGVVSISPTPNLPISAMSSSVTKSRSIPSSINFVPNLHYSGVVLVNNSPVIESP